MIEKNLVYHVIPSEEIRPRIAGKMPAVLFVGKKAVDRGDG